VNLLLPEVQAVLRRMARFNRPSDCYITPHENWMPTGTRQPCIGIKDAGITRMELTCGIIELTATVDLVGFARMTVDGGTAIVGNEGVFPLLDEASALLSTFWDQGFTGIQGVKIGMDRPTELYQAENTQWIVKLVRTMIYTVQR